MRISDWSSDVCSSDLSRTKARGRPLAFPTSPKGRPSCPRRYRRIWRPLPHFKASACLAIRRRFCCRRSPPPATSSASPLSSCLTSFFLSVSPLFFIHFFLPFFSLFFPFLYFSFFFFFFFF